MTSLNLAFNGIGAEGVGKLAAVLRYTEVAHLNLMGRCARHHGALSLLTYLLTYVLTQCAVRAHGARWGVRVGLRLMAARCAASVSCTLTRNRTRAQP